MPKPTNNELAVQIKNVSDKQNKFEKYIHGKFRDLTPKIDAMHDFIVGQEAIKNQPRGQGLNIAPDVIKIILWLVAIIAALIGVTKLPQ